MFEYLLVAAASAYAGRKLKKEHIDKAKAKAAELLQRAASRLQK